MKNNNKKMQYNCSEIANGQRNTLNYKVTLHDDFTVY